MPALDLKGITDAFVSVITGNVPDPLFSGDDTSNTRKVGRFVEVFKPHYKAKTPYVVVSLPDIPTEYAEAGSIDEDFVYRYEVRIVVAKGQSGYVSGIKYTGIELLEMLASDIAAVIKANAKITTGIKIIRKENSGGYAYDPTREFHNIVQFYLAEVVNTN